MKILLQNIMTDPAGGNLTNKQCIIWYSHVASRSVILCMCKVVFLTKL